MIPLSAVTKLVPTVGALQVNHQGQQPSMTISFNLAPGYALGAAVDAIREIEQETNLPASIVSGFQGAAQVFQDSLKGQGVLVLAAVFASFVVLGILYESFIHPITIISGLPSAGVGALIVLIMFKMDLSVIAMIGIVMLVGIVKKNAIMMIDFALQRRAVGLSAEEAIREACLLRFRPIMMTSLAAIFGALPIALGAGAGAELRQPLGVAVVGGLLVSQLLTLYITPVVYLYLDKADRILKRRLNPPVDLEARHPRAPGASRDRRGVMLHPHGFTSPKGEVKRSWRWRCQRARARLPKRPHVELAKDRIGSHKRNAFDFGLCGQHAAERIAMIDGQKPGMSRVFKRERQGFEAEPGDNFEQSVCQRFRSGPFSRAGLVGNFECRDRAHIHDRLGLFNGIARLVGQASVAVEKPKQSVAIEQNPHRPRPPRASIRAREADRKKTNPAGPAGPSSLQSDA